MRLILFITLSLVSSLVLGEPIEYAKKLTIASDVYSTDRTLRVSLLASYDSNSSASYPVLYVVRGQLDLLAAVASLDMLDSEVPEFIVVGIDGDVGDFFPSRDGAQTDYSKFVHNDVVPYIQKNYKAAPYSVISGHSMAAIFVVTQWFERGTDFDKYILISPPLENGRINKGASALKPKALNLKKPLLVTVGNEGQAADQGFKDLSETLSGYQAASFKRFVDQTHMSTRVVSTVYGLRQAFPNWKPSKEIREGSLRGLDQHYKNLSKQYGYKVDVPLDMLARMSAMDSIGDDKDKNANAIATIKYVLARNSKDADKLFDVAGQLMDIGRPEANKRLVASICRQVPQDTRCVIH